MFPFVPLRVNAQSQFTLAGVAGEFRLYVDPDGLKQNWLPPGSIRAKPQDNSGYTSILTASRDNGSDTETAAIP
jgi:hypothetical protein